MKIPSCITLALILTSAVCSAVQTIAPPESTPQSAPSMEIMAPQESSARSSMMIDPKMRAQDFQQAYDMLKKEKTAGKVYFQLADGSMIGSIIDMTPMANGTMVLFRYNSSQGIKFQIVKIEDIVTLRY